MNEKSKQLAERLLTFTVNTFKFIKTLPYKKEYDVFKYQLSKSASSIGANYEEAQACSKKEFYQRINICLREARETNYWLRALERLDLGDKIQRSELIQESQELKLIFGSIHSKKIAKS